MFNSKYKKESLANLKVEYSKYQKKYGIVMNDINQLHESRLKTIVLIKEIENYINSIANRSKEFDKTLDLINIRYKNYENSTKRSTLEVISVSGQTFVSAATATYGSGLLGTGTLVMGPVGWVIGGAALVGGGVIANSKNKKEGKKAEDSIRQIKIEIEKISEIDIKVSSIRKQIIEFEKFLKPLLEDMIKWEIRDYLKFTDTQLDDMKKLINTTLALSRKINEKVNV